MSPRVTAIVPVFNRLPLTRACLDCLRAQSHAPLDVIVVDGGSTDDTPAVLRADYPEVTVLTSTEPLWWAGATAKGIDALLARGPADDDLALLLNNDTRFGPDYVATLVRHSRAHDAAVGGLIVDSRDQRITDAGVAVDWERYDFPARTEKAVDGPYFDGPDVLTGRGVVVPVHMIRAAGNVDAASFPHYIADYDWYLRLKAHGFRFGIAYDAVIESVVEATGMAPERRRQTLADAWAYAFSRRSMLNLQDHLRFIDRHAPGHLKAELKRRQIRSAIGRFVEAVLPPGRLHDRMVRAGDLVIAALMRPREVWRRLQER